MKLLADKVVLITGASQGIGKGIAIRCAKHGANIAFTHLSSPDKAKEVENELIAIGVKAKGYQSDASEFESSHKLVEDVMEDFGQIDVLVNNAGITKDGLLMRMSEQDWDDVLRVNLKSIFNMTKAVQRTMLKQRKGSIINLSSVVGVNGNAGQSNYSASKAGMIGFTKSIAKELGSRNIRSNAIAPGFIATKMTAKLDQDVVGNWVKEIPLKRAGTTEDVADVCVFLASEMSAYVTGQTIHVCGGMLT
ncbi:MAG: 3-oxoacyl-[acyl-carrier-protein] reductase [Flavobacteriales bacterium]|jgi:3-oxoacyl-[acyl-carrier protein] reductase|tara:strand:- start:2512 stop:3258 length:747 start_codon:yes stop_codon:yes gene_type:complete